jgi:glycosyl transferase family 4
MWPPSGTVLYVRDLALELKRQGHAPAVFSSTYGAVVKELRNAGVTVTDRVDRLEQPDIIHANHRAPFLMAARRWPKVPAIYVCHTHDPRLDAPPLNPGVRRYFGVSRACVRRVADGGVPEGRVGLLLNFVDTARFLPREPLPPRPRRALVFSNYAQTGTHLPAVLEACRQAGIDVDVVGEGVGRVVTSPERLLPEYDLVYAKAKAAMEAMAVGNAVVLCDFAGVGPMVTSAQFDELRPVNFGFEALSEPLRPEPLLREMSRYDPADAARVRDLIRSTASLTAAGEQLVRIYREVLAEPAPQEALAYSSTRWHPPSIRQSVFLRVFSLWYRIPRRRREGLKTLPGVLSLIAAVRRLA